MKASTLARSGLMKFLCRAARGSDLDRVLKAAVRACLSVSGSQRARARLRRKEASRRRGGADSSARYVAEVPIEVAGQACGTVSLAATEPVVGAAYLGVASVAEVLSMWEARRRLAASFPEHTIVGRSAELLEVELLAQRYAPLDEPVLIQGETGVGKELIARTIHCLSRRSDQPLWAFNCAAVPEELLVSELFGHRRGAFTGAVRNQQGRLETADGATLFLDEVADLGEKLQAALLRVIEYGEIQRLGDEGKSRRINVRVLAASNRDLAAEVAAGRFRSDLYYRLSPLTVRVPALRERPEDIPVLARHFVHCLEESWGESLELVTEAIELLVGYSFPGNVRELRNLVLRAAATCADGRIEQVGSPHLSFGLSGCGARTGDANGTAAKGKGLAIGNGLARLRGNGAPDEYGPTGAYANRATDGQRMASGNGNRSAGAYAATMASGSSGNAYPPPNGNGSVNGAGNRHGSVNGQGPLIPAWTANTSVALNPLVEGAVGCDDISLDAVTAAHLRRVLAIAEGNVSRAARLLEIPRTTLQSKLQRYGVRS